MPVITLVTVTRTVSAAAAQAERCWYDTARWAEWVDGLDSVTAVQGDWPRVGSTVTWRSGPAGRGRVIETVTAYEPLGGQTVAVTDDTLAGEQTVAFAPAGDGAETEITLELRYRIARRNPFTPLVDWLFVRRVMAASLAGTLERFAASLDSRR